MWQKVAENPVMTATAIRSILFATMAFGVGMTVEQVGSVMGAVEAILALFTRQQTVSTARIEQKVDERVAFREAAGTSGTGLGVGTSGSGTGGYKR